MTINVPFSPAFIFSSVNQLFGFEDTQVEGRLSYDMAKIDILLSDESVVIDKPRVGAILDNQDATETLERMECGHALPIHRAFFAFACTYNDKWSQGGILRMPYKMLSHWFTLHGVVMRSHFEEHNPSLVVTSVERDLYVVHAAEIKNIFFLNSDEMLLAKESTYFFRYSYLFKIIEDRQQYTIDSAASEYELIFDETFWSTYIMPSARSMLEKEVVWDQERLFALIPCLCDAEFSKKFFLRLKNEKAETKEFAQCLIATMPQLAQVLPAATGIVSNVVNGIGTALSALNMWRVTDKSSVINSPRSPTLANNKE